MNNLQLFYYLSAGQRRRPRQKINLLIIKICRLVKDRPRQLKSVGTKEVSFIYKSFFLNILNEIKKGTTAHSINKRNAINKPKVVPKDCLKIAPV